MTTTAPTTTAVAYRIDADDVVAETGHGWDAFAWENRGPHDVVGRPLWDFVGGEDVRAVWRLLLRQVRGGRPVSFTFRCDGPFERRLMRMKLSPLAEGGVAFVSRPLWSEPALAVIPQGPVTVCGWCARVRVGGWIGAADAVTFLGLARTSSPPRLTHGICDECAAALRAL